jgi:pyrroloquinoline quinone biosynthesis protein B
MMRIKLLGTAAGGGVPQPDCWCKNCRACRAGDPRVKPRRPFSVAVGDPGSGRWFLVAASPDMGVQLEMLPRRADLGPIRGNIVDGILLPSADRDAVLGLELPGVGERPRIYATPAVRHSLREGKNLEVVLEAYGGADWPTLPVGRTEVLTWADGRPSGFACEAFPVPGLPPRYLRSSATPDPLDAVALRFVDERTGGRLIIAPSFAALDDPVVARMTDCDALLIDGTFWSEDELQSTRGHGEPASVMGHLPICAPGGSLARLAGLPVPRKVYIHINNTNPMLWDDSPERKLAEAAGFEVGHDGWECSL